MVQIKQAVILAGGQGTRLRPVTLHTPKPMIKIKGKPFLEYIIESLIENNIKDIVILTGYLHEKIERHFGNGEKYGIKISYSFSSIADDTGTRLIKAKRLLKKNFLLLYSDNYWPLQIKKLIGYYSAQKKLGLVTVYANQDNYSKNNIYVNKDGLVENYDKTVKNKSLNGVDIGYFIFNREILTHYDLTIFSLEKDLLPLLIKDKQLCGYISNHKYYGLSTPNRIPRIKNFFTQKRCIFLDRDGVINKKAAKAQYITDWKEFVFLPGVLLALQLLKQKGFVVYIVTNQPGIARNMVTKKQLKNIHTNLSKTVKVNGGEIKEIFVCEHGWNDGCFCRKPHPGMFFQAASKYDINLYKSYCVGDDQRDIIAGQKAGCKTFLVNKRRNLLSIVQNYL